MARNYGKIYKSRTPAEIALKILIALVIVLIVAAVVLYFSLKRYIVTDADGLHLEVPLLSEAAADDTPDGRAIIIEE